MVIDFVSFRVGDEWGLFIVWVIWFEGNSGVAFGVVLIF